ncbi:MAG TPA: phosphatase PAP2 family protein [Bryobacteraceae bacterium]|jgi:membrane-associated phospholipid phosphatase|nr:phosphatase PAP2 family protein [Bryobacteraceae bacterium]
MNIWLPERSSAVPTHVDRLRFGLFTLVPWLGLYSIVAALGVPLNAIELRLPFERRLPVTQWTEIIYISDYFAVPLVAAFVRSQRVLRIFMVQVWVAMAIAFPLYVIVPVRAPRPAYVPITTLGHLLSWERSTYPPVAAFPSFHVIWAILVAETFADRGKATLWIARMWAAAVAVSCLTTGMHSIADVVAGFVVAWLALNCERIMESLRRARA